MSHKHSWFCPSSLTSQPPQRPGRERHEGPLTLKPLQVGEGASRGGEKVAALYLPDRAWSLDCGS